MENTRLFAFTQIYNQHKKAVYHYSLKMTGYCSSAEDIVQCVFLKLYEKFETINNFDSIKYWLIKTARNEVYSRSRNKMNGAKEFDEADISQPMGNVEADFEMKELSGLINDELNLLEPDFREIYILREYSGLTYDEIAGVLNISKELVKSRLYQIRTTLIKNISKKLKD